MSRIILSNDLGAKHIRTYSKLCQTSKMGLFAEKVNDF